ncbi:class I SAM-dependent methyltransferase [Candidatus Micrarchaeota archaeon]|nr:class I SAM-dependent methyltransferase [Candidatus Micrarchaeota archaeon]
MYKKNFISILFLKARHKKTIELLDGIKPKRILDVGCDDGHFLGMLSEKFPDSKLYGCDLDGIALEEARKVCPKAEFSEGDFTKLDFKPVDLVLMLEIIEHSKDPRKMLEKAVKLTSKGHILVSMPRPELLRWRMIWGIWSSFSERWKGQHSKLTEKQLIEMAQKLGLKLEKHSWFFFGCISIMLFRNG